MTTPTAHVEGADHHRAAIHFLGDMTVGFELLVLARQIVTVQK